MGMYGYIWVCIGMYGYVWIYMGMILPTPHQIPSISSDFIDSQENKGGGGGGQEDQEQEEILFI